MNEAKWETMTRIHEAIKAGEVREMEGQVREKFWRLRRAKGRSARGDETVKVVQPTRRDGKIYRVP